MVNDTRDIKDWFSANASVNAAYVAVCDINGTLRGKRIPAAHVAKVSEGGMRMPLSSTFVDIWGEDLRDSGLVFETGDGDGLCEPTGRGVIPMPWLDQPAALVPIWMREETGAPYAGDPRRALAAVLDKYAALGLTPVATAEMEFYLVDPSEDTPVPAAGAKTGAHPVGENVLSVTDLHDHEAFLSDVYAACVAQDIPADAAISEGGPGQFEINLLHSDDALRSADNAVLFKHLTHGIARQHGYAATFMAKPYADAAGCGMHIHFSVLDGAGKNVFDDGSEEGSDTLRHAVGGVLASLQENTLIFAPHQNSYRRIRPKSHAPTAASWGYENRTAAIRIPGGNPKARRIEHRVAGGDTNPYLVLAAVLGGALHGIEQKIVPPAPVTGDASNQDLPNLPTNWMSAIEAFEAGQISKIIFSPMMHGLISKMKRQELNRFLDDISPFEYQTYLEVV